MIAEQPPARPVPYGAEPRFFTIGHSNRRLDALAALARRAGVETICDVRTVPRSRANPQFNADFLAASLETRGLGYQRMPGLGGLRGRSKDAGEANALWRNASFRNYADYAMTPAFAAALDELIALGSETTPAAMCAEALWWRCHRRIIADHLIARGYPVFHIMDSGVERAKLTPGAAVERGRVTYPPLQKREID